MVEDDQFWCAIAFVEAVAEQETGADSTMSQHQSQHMPQGGEVSLAGQNFSGSHRFLVLVQKVVLLLSVFIAHGHHSSP
jgi:hypothetical protein